MDKIKLILSFSILLLSGQVNSAVIDTKNVNAEYAPGKIADFQGLQWLSLDVTSNISRDTTVNGFLGTDSIFYNYDSNASNITDSWRYATRLETETLVNSLWGGVYSGYSNDNFEGARWFADIFGYGDGFTNSSFENFTYSGFYYGMDGECNLDITYTCYGVVRSADSASNDLTSYNITTNTFEIGATADNPIGFISDGWGASLGWQATQSSSKKSTQERRSSSLLVRNVSTVPAPPALLLFIPGLLLLGLIGVKWHRKAA
jgi:hypothetical protein